ncbi:ABC transporter ATP-binding protein [Alteromonas facilis]|uniref:ABC transporter ATP-binding protein n=1 Tax=Alteromonas facilis TaxID=2048004 RepID=UPI000C293EBA|nr:ABC transporter ATP-binding protein [Alteromonas facilis]
MLKIENLTKTYSDGTKALNNISLSLPKGMIGLLGPNGAGKSTLMRTLASLQSPDSGNIVFNGVNTLTSPQLLRQQLGYLPQYFGVYPNMNCLSLMKHMSALKGIKKSDAEQQIHQLLELTNLTHVAKKRVSTFSGGMRQRFGIAQALLGDPKLIIMDEPTSGLDPMERGRLNDLLVSISQNKLILLSTHIVEDIESLCTHVALMNKGEIIEYGSVNSLIAPLKGRVWKADLIQDSFSKTQILNKRFIHGLPEYRLFSSVQPSPNAESVTPSLQDRYFYELNHVGGTL